MYSVFAFCCYCLILQAFWDYLEKKQLGTTKAEWSVTSEWSPDGCYFMTATTAPRLQVDNGYVFLMVLLSTLFRLLRKVISCISYQ